MIDDASGRDDAAAEWRPRGFGFLARSSADCFDGFSMDFRWVFDGFGTTGWLMIHAFVGVCHGFRIGDGKWCCGRVTVRYDFDGLVWLKVRRNRVHFLNHNH